MGKLEQKLGEMGYTLPEPFKYPSPNRQGCVQVGNILFVSGHGRDLPPPAKSDGAGKVGVEVTVEEGYETAKQVMLSILASLNSNCEVEIQSYHGTNDTCVANRTIMIKMIARDSLFGGVKHA